MSYVDIKIDATAALASLDRVVGAVAKVEALRGAMRDVVQPIISHAKSIVQQPGKAGYWQRTGARKSRKHIRDTIGAAVRVYNKAIVGVVGPLHPAGAAGHLLERGHQIAAGHGKGRQIQKAQKASWTDEMRWSKSLQKMVFVHGKRTRNTRGARIVESMGRTKPFPFMSVAMEAQRSNVLANLTDTIRAHVERAAAAGGG